MASISCRWQDCWSIEMPLFLVEDVRQEKVNVLTFLPHSVILRFFLIGQFIIFEMVNYKSSLNTKGAFSFLAYGIYMAHISYSLFFPSSICCGVLNVFQYLPALCSIILCAPILPKSFY